jgi:hypothetical protein
MIGHLLGAGLLSLLIFTIDVPLHGATFTFTPLSIVGITGPQVTGINNSGAIVGSGGTGQAGVGFVTSAGVITTISVPGTSGTQVLGVNDRGQVLGSFYAGAGANALCIRTACLPPSQHRMQFSAQQTGSTTLARSLGPIRTAPDCSTRFEHGS